jgi:diguanylate cyclase
MVAGVDNPEEIDPGGVGKMLRLIQSLRASPAGSVIYRQLECMLDDLAASHRKVEIAYAGFVESLLDAFASQLAPGSPRFVQVKLLQARLQPPLTAAELNTLSEFVAQCANDMRQSQDAGAAAMHAAISPLLRAFGIEEPESVARVPPAAGPARVATEPFEFTEAPEPAPEGVQVSALAPPVVLTDEEADSSPEQEEGEVAEEPVPGGTQPTGGEAVLSEAVMAEETAVDESHETGAEAGTPSPTGTVDVDYHYELETRREDIRQLQSSLGQQVMETITQNEEFGVILEVVLAELREAEDVAGIENARWTLIREVDKLMKGHNELADKLDNTHHYLQLVESDSRELTDELSRVRMLSLTDELTGLANRRAFVRRLEDEVARVQRYGFPLSFALIDLDHFKGINDEFGHAAGDEVLRVYAKNILSVFRHHDMVARYGGEEFAVLLPNTDADGAIRALNKVRRRAAETRWQSNGTVSQVPSFSAGVSLFKPGESASAFIERADKALYRAKRLGRDRIELDITYETEESRRSPRRRSTDL